MRFDWRRLLLQILASLAGGIGAVNLGRLTVPDVGAGPADLAGWVGLPALAGIAPGVSAERLVAYWFAQDSRVDEGVLADVAALRARGIAVHLATNQEHLRAEWLRERFAGLVDGVQYSACLGAKKPDRAFFALAAAAVGVPAEQLVLVDDTAANVAAARAAGWQAAPWTGEDRLLALAG